MPPHRHGELVRACLQVITARGGLAWKNATGTFQTASGRVIQTGRRGLPDIVGCLPATRATTGSPTTINAGRLLAVEVKVGRDPVAPHQQAMLEELRQRGALVVVVRDSIDALLAALR